MKIPEYIIRHLVLPVVQSDIDPTPMPTRAFIEGLTTSFEGQNQDRSISVTLYEREGRYCVLTPNARITGMMNEDNPALN